MHAVADNDVNRQPLFKTRQNRRLKQLISMILIHINGSGIGNRSFSSFPNLLIEA